jgi:hypothetical protein
MVIKRYFMKLFQTLICLFIFSRCIAQVPVSQEPRHHKVLDNGHVRLLDVHIPPGDTTQYHIHATASVFVVLTDANTGSQVISEEDRSASPVKHYGNIWFEGFYIKPRIHRVFNSDGHAFNVMDIELTNKNYRTIDLPIQQNAFSFLFEEKPVRAYQVKLTPGEKIFLEPRRADILMIQSSDSTDLNGTKVILLNNQRAFSNHFHKKGDFAYMESGDAIEINNEGSGNAEFAFFELK